MTPSTWRGCARRSQRRWSTCSSGWNWVRSACHRSRWRASEQARRAGRIGVSLDTVLRRYVRGSALLGEYVMEEADRAGFPGGSDAEDECPRPTRSSSIMSSTPSTSLCSPEARSAGAPTRARGEPGSSAVDRPPRAGSDLGRGSEDATACRCPICSVRPASARAEFCWRSANLQMALRARG